MRIDRRTVAEKEAAVREAIADAGPACSVAELRRLAGVSWALADRVRREAIGKREPAEVVGTDGKRYPRRRPRPGDAVRAAGWFGYWLKRLRKKAGMTQAQLAQLAGMTSGGVARLESGQRSPSWLDVLALADALGATPNQFRRDPARRA